jgi:lipopolysaccharide export system protein LptC
MSTALHDEPGGRQGNVWPLLRRTWRTIFRLWDGMAIYVPLLLMGALALGTYWLVRNTPMFITTEATKEVGHEVDYFMHKFTVKTFDESGKLKSEIYGIDARHFADTDILEIDQARIRSINVEGHVTTATGNRAYVNGDGSEVQLTGNAVVVREPKVAANGKETPRMEFRGEFLHAFLNDERVKSHKPVVLIRGADQFTGDTFAYDNLDQVADLKGRVRGVLVPSHVAGSKGGKAAPSTAGAAGAASSASAPRP